MVGRTCGVGIGLALGACLLGCGTGGDGEMHLPPLDGAREETSALASGRWEVALTICTRRLGLDPADCSAQYCELVAHTMLFLDEFNSYLLPLFRGGVQLDSSTLDLTRLMNISLLMSQISVDSAEVADRRCEYTLPHLPLRIGDPADPLVLADVRGRWTPRSAQLIGAIFASLRYLFSVVSESDLGGIGAGERLELPPLLAELQARIAAHDALLWSVPADPAVPQGGWLDRNGDGRPDAADELLIDLFEPDSDRRIFDFRGAELVRGEALPRGRLPIPKTAPHRSCQYRRWHIETLYESPQVGTTDGMSFSPDGQRLAFPMRDSGTYQIHIAAAAGTNPVCVTCDGPRSWNDGVRWRPGTPGDTLLFLSNRDHPFSISGAGGGAGQELYAMRPDGSQVTRLTVSPAWATNYHPNWSLDGQHIVWVTTAERTWDVMVADFVEAQGQPQLVNRHRLVHDTTWWEAHGFTQDNTAVLTTNTRAGFQSADIYLVEIATGARTRLTDDLSWDEHAHLSPDGRVMSFVSGRWRPAAMQKLTNGALSPVYDFFWIVPTILFGFRNPPVGFSTELTLLDADGARSEQLTSDDEVVADNVWSPDGTRILFRQTPVKGGRPSRLRLLTFDDCQSEEL